MNARRAVFLKIVLPQALLIVCLGLFTGTALGAGAQSAPAIDISNAQVYVTNGVPTCCVNVAADKVKLAVNGAHDYDCPQGNPGDRIDLSKTRWYADPEVGELDYQTGSTNEWLAKATGTTMVEVFFNDKDDGPEYDDDESSPKSIQVTGFIVGCHLTTNEGGSFKRYCDGTTSGSTSNLSGTLSHYYNRETPEFGYDQGTETHSSYASAEWKAIVYPTGTEIKGSIQVPGGATGESGVALVQTTDNDAGDGGSHRITIGLSFILSFQYSESTEGDDCVSSASAGVAFQGDEGWIDRGKEDTSDYSRDSGQQPSEVSFSHSPDTAYFTGAPGDVKKSDFMIGYQCTVFDDTLWNFCTVHASCHVDWEFSIPEDPAYLPATN